MKKAFICVSVDGLPYRLFTDDLEKMYFRIKRTTPSLPPYH